MGNSVELMATAMATTRSNSSATVPKDAGDALDPRVYLAAERTLLAWIRTGVALMGLGFLVAKFGLFVRELSAIRGGEAPAAPGVSLWLGCALIVLGIVATLLAAGEYVWLLRRLRMIQAVGSLRLGMTAGLALVMSLAGVLLASYLLFL